MLVRRKRVYSLEEEVEEGCLFVEFYMGYQKDSSESSELDDADA